MDYSKVSKFVENLRRETSGLEKQISSMQRKVQMNIEAEEILESVHTAIFNQALQGKDTVELFLHVESEKRWSSLSEAHRHLKYILKSVGLDSILIESKDGYQLRKKQDIDPEVDTVISFKISN